MHDTPVADAAPPAVEEPSVHEPPGRPWELELLVSGAVVFALLQLPGVVDRTYWRLDPQTVGTMNMVLFGAYYFATLALYALIASFVLHLAARAYWVGLVGLDAVFPAGVLWDRLRYGPVTREVYRQRQPSVQRLIDRSDRFCSVIFSFSFSLVLILLIGTALAAVAGLAAWAISRFLLGGEHVAVVFFVLVGALALVQTAATLVDGAFGERLVERGRPGRVLRRIIGWLYSAQLMVLYQPVFNILYTNVGKKTIVGVLQVVVAVLIGVFMVRAMARHDRLAVDSYAYLPAAPGETSVDYRHYESQWSAGETLPAEPSIQSDMIREPFVRLFLPYVPSRHNPAVEARCPDLEPLQASGPRFIRRSAREAADERAGEALRCLAGLQRVTLNGVERTDLEFRFYEHPRNHLRGIVSYIPTAGLPAGENLLVVGPVPDPDPEGDGPPPPPHYIPFWIAR